MQFADELNEVLPPDLPGRVEFIPKAARHLELILEANQHFNLTRITNGREAAIKHVLDSVMPWRLFASAGHVTDAGTGAGFPGIPLAILLPSVRFVLAESIGKKARFVEAAVGELGLANVAVANQRAEELLRTTRTQILTARAVAPISRALDLFGPFLRGGTKALLFKGPDAQAEIAAAAADLRKRRISARIIEQYSLPDGLGDRTIVEMSV